MASDAKMREKKKKVVFIILIITEHESAGTNIYTHILTHTQMKVGEKVLDKIEKRERS